MYKDQLLTDYQIIPDEVVDFFPDIPSRARISIDYINKFFIGHGHYQIELDIVFFDEDDNDVVMKYFATTNDMEVIDYWDENLTDPLVIVLKKNEEKIYSDSFKYCKIKNENHDY